MKWGKLLFGYACLLIVGVSLLDAHSVHAADEPTEFNLQVTPSPLVTTVKPGVTSTVELKIRNGGSAAEELKIEPRTFTFNSATGQVDLQNDTPANVSSWISFSAPKFVVQPGQWFTQTVTFSVPKEAGFSYSFALVISRQSLPKPVQGARLINGSVAVFSLINVDRPGATSSLDVVSFSSAKKVYEYLPAKLDIRFRNSGNTIVQPYGNIFIQRSESSKDQLASLQVNETRAYILPGTERTVSVEWDDGFATYQSQKQPDGTTKQHLSTDWSKFSHFRIGPYTAKLVAVYSDGQHDIPIQGTVTFWVIPWRAILCLIAAIVALVLLGRWRNKRRTAKAVKRALAAQEAARKPAKPAPEHRSEDQA